MDRRVEVLVYWYIWIPIQFKNLKKGDIFRLYDPDGSLVKDSKGNSIFVVEKEPYPWLDTGTLAVDIVGD